MKARHFSFVVVASPFVLSIGLVACALEARSLREVTEAPGFSQVANDKIRSSMHVMAANALALDAALDATPEETDEATRQSQVIGALDGMFAAASGIRPSGEQTNHPMLDKHMPDFLRGVHEARAAAATSPPSYFLASNVVSQCAACHRDTQR